MIFPTSARYASKRDVPYAVLVWAAAAVCVGATVLAGLEDPVALLAMALISALTAGLMGWIWFGTYYVFADECLVCRSGPFTERIRLERVVSVRATKNMLSSMALSRDRLEIRYGPRSYQVTMVSPVDRKGFLDDLRLRCPAASLGDGTEGLS